MRASAYDPITDLSKKLCRVLTFLRSNINIERKVDNLHNVRIQLFVFKVCNTTMFQKHLEKYLNKSNSCNINEIHYISKKNPIIFQQSLPVCLCIK
jgi:hypothetical protein